MLRISLLAWATLIVVPSPSYALLARFVDTSLVISNGAERIRLPDITGRTVISRVVHAVVKQQGDYFVVFTVRAPTGRPSNGYCGAGIDSSVEWLRIHDGKVADSQEVALESCIDDRDEGKVSGWRGGRFIVETHDAREVRTIRFAFDPLNPAKRIEEVGSEPDYHTPPL